MSIPSLPRVVAAFALALALAAGTACAGSASSDGTVSRTAAVHDNGRPVALDGTWAFDLDASDPASDLRERCAARASGDGAKESACYAEIRDAASREKIRFAKRPDGTHVFTSFADEDGREVVFAEIPVELVADGPRHVAAKAVGEARGTRAAELDANVGTMRIELVDENTIATLDPKKGRLVFAKR